MARPPNPDASRKLLDAARASFAEVGVDAARIQDIAAAAGFSKAAFYLYFESKEQVFERLIADTFAEFDAQTDHRHQAFSVLIHTLGPCSAADWAGRTERWRAYQALDHAATVASLQAMWDNRDMIRCILEHTVGPRRHLVDRLLDTGRRALSTRLEEAARLGLLRPDLDPDLLSDLIYGIYLQLARRLCRAEVAPDLEALARAVDGFLNDGLSLRPGKDGA
jgi:AcrR family transcriptional regulator